MISKFDLSKREVFGLYFAFILAGYAQPWWLFVLVGAIGGVMTAGRSAKSLIVISLLAGLSWITAAMIQDAFSGGRISRRLAGLFTLRFPLALYAGIFVIAAVPALFAALSARFLTQAIQLGEKP